MNVLPTVYQQIIYKSRYSRYLEEFNRRENWDETVWRYISFFRNHLEKNLGRKVSEDTWAKLYESILNLKALPSMRCMMTAGPALARDNTAAYNCSYLPITKPKDFADIMSILMCGTGVGFSVERQYINKLPVVPNQLEAINHTIIVEDSKEGWASAYEKLISLLYTGFIPNWDISKVRPAGSRLKTFGGRASGPEPLVELFKFTIAKFQNAQGRKLTSIECHDIATKIGAVVVVGGVRRSAMISLSNLSDDRMRHAKSGQWWNTESHRALANNSVAYTEKPEVGIYLDEFKSLYDSKSGERGFFNRVAAQDSARKIRRDAEIDFGTNPCGEINLRPYEFCNLSEAVARYDDTEESLGHKIAMATILGTFQSTLTSFRFIDEEWTWNTENERLLGVSLTGIMDCPLLNGQVPGIERRLQKLNEICIAVNRQWAEFLGISPSAARTCIKPSGTVSQLVNSSSGIHTSWNDFWIRRIRADKKDPLTQFLINSGVPYEDDVTFPEMQAVFSFPMKASPTSINRKQFNAIQQLNHWLIYKKHFTDHNPSTTIYVKENEWPSIQAWVWENFDSIGGLAFLPSSDHIYKQAPYEDCDELTFQRLISKMPKNINWEDLKNYESEDNTSGTQEVACSGGSCEIVNIGQAT
jgi:ribonucleoside-diphosphate reductase alpha chain